MWAPKFRTPGGAEVSLRHGVWDPVAEAYDEDRLVFLNGPVLKCHGAVYGVTGAVKHHLGTVTTALNTGSHAAVRTGGCGTFLAEVRMPDLNILDCIFSIDVTTQKAARQGPDQVAIAIQTIGDSALVSSGYSLKDFLGHSDISARHPAGR